MLLELNKYPIDEMPTILLRQKIGIKREYDGIEMGINKKIKLKEQFRTSSYKSIERLSDRGLVVKQHQPSSPSKPNIKLTSLGKKYVNYALLDKPSRHVKYFCPHCQRIHDYGQIWYDHLKYVTLKRKQQILEQDELFINNK